MEYKEYYELFKQYPEWEIEHHNHKEGFNGEGNPELEQAIVEMVEKDDTLFLYKEKAFHFSMLLLNKQYADLDFWVCTTHALHDVSESPRRCGCGEYTRLVSEFLVPCVSCVAG